MLGCYGHVMVANCVFSVYAQSLGERVSGAAEFVKPADAVKAHRTIMEVVPKLRLTPTIAISQKEQKKNLRARTNHAHIPVPRGAREAAVADRTLPVREGQ